MDDQTRRYLDVKLEKLDPMAVDIHELKEAVITQNGRLGNLERWKAYLTGGFTMLGLIAGGSAAAWVALLR